MPLTAVRTGPATYAVASESDESKVYTVSLELKSCSCPHHQHRKAHCKHLVAATAACALEVAVRVKRVPDAAIGELFFKYESRPEIAGAITREIEYRQAQVETEARNRAIFS